MKGRKKAVIFLLVGLLWLYGCSSTSSDSASIPEGREETGADLGLEAELVYERSMEIRYAENFKVDYYKGGYTLLTTTIDGARYFVVPEDKEVPQNLEKEIPGREIQNSKVVVLKRPVKDIYLVASSAMDAFSELDGLGAISFSGQKEDGWYME